MKLSSREALQISRRNPGKRFPNDEEPRYKDGLLFPYINPKFSLDTPAKTFTIGSCFARNIELVLQDYDVELPTLEFNVPKSEWEFRPNGLLNEYNPGTTAQRILWALGEGSAPEDTIIETKDGFLDLLLPGGFPVSLERAIARRAEIDEVYRNLASSDLVIITLGLVEAWFDEENEVFLNRMPTPALLKSQPDRYSFQALDVADSVPLLNKALKKLMDAGVDKLLLTVSPVPLGTSFTGKDAVVANSFSKAALRVCAERLTNRYPQVDYFPSFEIVSSGGLGAFREDNIHVNPKVVERVTGYMLESYFPDLPSKTGGSRKTEDVRT